ncbi:hypothetical protein PV797_11690 [Clostridiaceae bacterium M8S5]|nr:hypothetical protein PV797_11690 [Clostridiaceae bacterium M8S5]
MKSLKKNKIQQSTITLNKTCNCFCKNVQQDGANDVINTVISHGGVIARNS